MMFKYNKLLLNKIRIYLLKKILNNKQLHKLNCRKHKTHLKLLNKKIKEINKYKNKIHRLAHNYKLFNNKLNSKFNKICNKIYNKLKNNLNIKYYQVNYLMMTILLLVRHLIYKKYKIQ